MEHLYFRITSTTEIVTALKHGAVAMDVAEAVRADAADAAEAYGAAADSADSIGAEVRVVVATRDVGAATALMDFLASGNY